MSDDTATKRAINWIWVLVVIAVAMLAAEVGWSLRARSTQDRYVLALAEKHEAAARYWDIKTNEILTNNTLNRRKQWISSATHPSVDTRNIPLKLTPKSGPRTQLRSFPNILINSLVMM